MGAFEITFVIFAVMLLLLFLGMHIGAAIGLVGFVGLLYITNLKVASITLVTATYNIVDNYVISAIPLFLLMGELAVDSGLSERIYYTAHKWVGGLPGGLAISTMLGAGGFGAISGSSTAAVAVMSTVAYPEMKRYGYDKKLATGCFTAGGTITGIIPPSLGLMLYGLLTETSIGRLFLAAIFPGLIVMLTYSIGIYFMAKLRPQLAPPVQPYNWKERLVALKGIWAVLGTFIIVMGGIYGGIFTPVEAASVGAFIMLLILTLGRAKTQGRSKWRAIILALQDTVLKTGTLFIILVSTALFAILLAKTGTPTKLLAIVTNWDLTKYVLMALLSIFILFLGMVLPPIAILLIFVPLLAPLALSVGFNNVHFGIIMLRLVETGLVTPPIGANLFMIKTIIKDANWGDISRGIIPFVLMDIVDVAIFIVFPQISLFIPNLMKGS